MAIDRIVVMGVAGSAKSTVGLELATRRGAGFVIGDQLRPPAIIAKMASGTPLTDEDRWPWLAAIRRALRSSDAVVVACSALRRAYRDALRGAAGLRFVHLVIDAEEARRRLTRRHGHFMQAGMVEGQFATLDPPAADETDVAVVDATATLAQVVARAEAALEGMRPGTGVVPLVAEVVRTELLGNGARRVLLVLPDITRSHSGAGHITGAVFSQLSAAGCGVAVREAIAHDRDLARNLGAAAHLVHGSSKGRFRIVYCTDPTSGGLSRKEVEGVGYEWRPVGTELERLGVDGSGSTGPRTDRGGRPFHHIAQPGLGLWTSRPIEG